MGLYRVDARTCSAKCRKRVSRKPAIPAEMTSRDRWVRRSVLKRPITVAGKPASSTDVATWSSFESARSSHAGSGLGYVLGDGIGCIDLDHCIEDGELASWAAVVVAANPGTYVEVSMSGTGLHIFGLRSEGPGRKIRDGRNIEIYSQGRYIAVTGNTFGKAPAALSELILI